MADPAPEKTAAEIRRTAYNRVVRQAQLHSIFLEKLDFDLKPEALTVEKESLKRSLESEVRAFSFDAEEGTCLGSIQWKITMRHRRRVLVRCTTTYLVLYDGIRGVEEEVARIFMENIGKGACYAYLRALFAQLDWASGIGSPPLPVLRLEPRV